MGAGLEMRKTRRKETQGHGGLFQGLVSRSVSERISTISTMLGVDLPLDYEIRFIILFTLFMLA